MLFYFASHRKIASQFFSVTNIEENHRCDTIAIPDEKYLCAGWLNYTGLAKKNFTLKQIAIISFLNVIALRFLHYMCKKMHYVFI